MKKRIITFITLAVVLFCAFALDVVADKFEENEEWYVNTCNNSDLAKQYATECQEYANWLSKRNQEINQQMDALQDKIDSLSDNIEESVKEISELEDQIAVLNKEINRVENEIAVIEADIAHKEELIVQRQTVIDETDAAIKQRMSDEQSQMGQSYLINYVMNATDLVDLISRLDSMKEILAYEDQKIEILEGEISQLEIDKQDLQNQKAAVEEKKAELDDKKAAVVKLKATTEALQAQWLAQEAEWLAQLNQYAADAEKYSDIYNNIYAAMGEMTPSLGWINPVPAARISAETWYYPKSFGGGLHLGSDFAAPVGTPIYAVANGYIFYRADACPTYGYLGSNCGYPGTGGGGNQVYLITRIDGKTYAVKYLHMKSGTPIAVSTTPIAQGTKVGEVGTSGNSTGPHCHVEIYYLGTMMPEEYLKTWDKDLRFGTGFGTAALKHTCDATGNKPPCRIEPKTVLY